MTDNCLLIRFPEDHEQLVSGRQLKKYKYRYSFDLHSDPWQLSGLSTSLLT